MIVHLSNHQRHPGCFRSDEKRRGRYILLCGGEFDPGKGKGPDTVLDWAVIFDAQRETLIDVGPMRHAHDDFAAAPLPPAGDDGRALIIGGFGPKDSFLPYCEIFSCNFGQLKNNRETD